MDFKIAFTDKEITSWGGMVFMKNLIEKTGILQQLDYLDLPQQGSNRGYCPKQLLQAFWISVWCGANRFMHLDILRADYTLQRLFGWKKMAGHRAFQRFFSKFTIATNHRVFHGFYQWFFDQLNFDNYTLDLDSTILTRYGSQSGATKSYNSKKRGRKCHHPLMAFVAECRMVANFWLRSGNTNATCNFESFLLDTLDKLQNKKIGLLRADGGFYSKEVFNLLESRSIQYIVAAQMYPILQRAIVAQSQWMPIARGIEITSIYYKSPKWEQTRRVVIIRQKIEERPEASGITLKLFASDEAVNAYKYSALVTNLNLPDQQVWFLYRNRADAENRIKELKEDFGLESFCMKDFCATEASLNAVMVAYNIMSLFRIAILKSNIQPQLKTLRYKIFAVPAYITKNGNERILNMAVQMNRRKSFVELFSQIKLLEMPYSGFT